MGPHPNKSLNSVPAPTPPTLILKIKITFCCQIFDNWFTANNFMFMWCSSAVEVWAESRVLLIVNVRLVWWWSLRHTMCVNDCESALCVLTIVKLQHTYGRYWRRTMCTDDPEGEPCLLTILKVHHTYWRPWRRTMTLILKVHQVCWLWWRSIMHMDYDKAHIYSWEKPDLRKNWIITICDLYTIFLSLTK